MENATNPAYQAIPPQYPAPGAGGPAFVQPMPVVNPDISPVLAFLLGLIPGVGAIYNAQYAKGLVHAVVFGMLISIAEKRELNGGFEGLFIMMAMIWFFYMAFEAYHTAKRRALGLPVDEFSSLIRVNPGASSLPVGPVILILAGVFFLLANFDLIRVEDFARFWPLLLILLGGYLLYARVRGASNSNNNGDSGSTRFSE